MAKEKRYFWLKLQNTIFDDKRIKKLRTLPNGDTFVIIYLKMMFKALNNEGRIEYTGLEETFAAEVALDLDESPENTAITVEFLLANKLLVKQSDVVYILPYVVENTGSEAASTIRSRECRERKALQCNKNATQRREREEKETEKTPLPPNGGAQSIQALCAQRFNKTFSSGYSGENRDNSEKDDTEALRTIALTSLGKT